jgi:hypothetical protein
MKTRYKSATQVKFNSRASARTYKKSTSFSSLLYYEYQLWRLKFPYKILKILTPVSFSRDSHGVVLEGCKGKLPTLKH